MWNVVVENLEILVDFVEIKEVIVVVIYIFVGNYFFKFKIVVF